MEQLAPMLMFDSSRFIPTASCETPKASNPATTSEAAAATEKKTAAGSTIMPPNPAEMTNEKRLNIRFTDASNRLQFVTHGLHKSLEELFLKVQTRLSRRLVSQEIQLLELHLLNGPEEIGCFALLRDDPDTWENFIELAGQMEGNKIQVIADVEV
jgi:hypothetical protein